MPPSALAPAPTNRRDDFRETGEAQRLLIERTVALSKPLAARDLRMLLAVMHHTASWSRMSATVRLEQLMATARIADERNARRCLTRLAEAGLIASVRAPGRAPRYVVSIAPSRSLGSDSSADAAPVAAGELPPPPPDTPERDKQTDRLLREQARPEAMKRALGEIYPDLYGAQRDLAEQAWKLDEHGVRQAAAAVLASQTARNKAAVLTLRLQAVRDDALARQEMRERVAARQREEEIERARAAAHEAVKELADAADEGERERVRAEARAAFGLDDEPEADPAGPLTARAAIEEIRRRFGWGGPGGGAT